MTVPDRATLLRLSDTTLSPADPGQDIRGRKVIDRKGDEIGQVDDLFIDDQEKKVRFVQVKSDGVLGLGTRKVLIPVDAIGQVTADAVHLDRGREHVAASPEYDPQLVDLSRDYADAVYKHYGFAPFWMMGYTYPTFPYRM